MNEYNNFFQTLTLTLTLTLVPTRTKGSDIKRQVREHLHTDFQRITQQPAAHDGGV
jgi:hypothetical protein